MTDKTKDDIRQYQEAYRQTKANLQKFQTERAGLIEKLNRCTRSNKAAIARGDYAGADLKAEADICNELEKIDTLIAQTQALLAHYKKLWQDATNATLQPAKAQRMPWYSGY